MTTTETRDTVAGISFGDHYVRVKITDANDHMQRYWVAGSFYESRGNGLLTWFYTNVPKGLRWIDAGACIGNHTLFMLSVMEAESVRSFEPVYSNVCQLYENVRANTFPGRWFMFPFALGAENGTCGMEMFGDNCGMYRCTEGDSATVVTLDAFGYDFDVLKIDVEGAEVDVLHGAMESIERCRPLIAVECTEEGRVKYMDGMLSGHHREDIVLNATPTYIYRPI